MSVVCVLCVAWYWPSRAFIANLPKRPFLKKTAPKKTKRTAIKQMFPKKMTVPKKAAPKTTASKRPDPKKAALKKKKIKTKRAANNGNIMAKKKAKWKKKVISKSE